MTAWDEAEPRAEPLILTAVLDQASQDRFERERQYHFPPNLNIVPAHVTLFHHLPGLQQVDVERGLTEQCRSQAPSDFTTTGMRFLGRGSAYVLDMPDVAVIRGRLAAAWQPWLTAQDRQSWRPHVTIQNKVSPDVAKRVFQGLSQGFAPWTGRVEGLCLWRYQGTWDFIARYPFRGEP